MKSMHHLTTSLRETRHNCLAETKGSHAASGLCMSVVPCECVKENEL